ncbi:HepT-like ribonuclease domain-containing protein [Paucibacter soli]|uniref:HepT-like ribonuclease domain-containing protein n=1 Tax=Paucibacter soli TaxID=3133433 RepID=UPI0030984559
MSRDPQRLPDYLGHILEAIERIQHYVDDMDEVGFLNSKLVQDAVIRNLEVIGEASRNIERVHPEFAAAHPELPLALANDMRNALAHGYFKVDLGIVWKTIQGNLPDLHAQITEVSAVLSRNSDHEGMEP